MGKIKGKIKVDLTIKKNILKNKPLNSYCYFEEFGINSLENRLLKKALQFVQRFCSTINFPKEYTSNFLDFIVPAFESVSSNVDINDIKYTKFNPFYKEYEEAIRLAKLLLQRYGYNITNIQPTQKVMTPPFWIDMSKLFELYVLGLLKDRFKEKVKYHYSPKGNELDFLLDSGSYQMVIDAKYKPKYLNNINHEDMRQVSGYARLEKVYKALKKESKELIDCMIIYPDMENGGNNLDDIDLLECRIQEYVGMYKIGIKLPFVK